MELAVRTSDLGFVWFFFPRLVLSTAQLLLYQLTIILIIHFLCILLYACMFKMDFSKFRNHGKNLNFHFSLLNDSVNAKLSMTRVFDGIPVSAMDIKIKKCMGKKKITGSLMLLCLLYMSRNILEEQYN